MECHRLKRNWLELRPSYIPDVHSESDSEVIILSRVRYSVTNNNGFWIGSSHSQWLSQTRSIPYWTTNVFSSVVTDLVLIYESVTSSASVVCWLTLHSWTVNSLNSVTTESFNSLTNALSFVTRGEPKRDHHLEQFVCYYLFHPLLRNVFTEPLSSNGLFRIYSLPRESVLLPWLAVL
jgi:hypothetical protein